MVMAMIATPKGFDPDIWVPGQIEAAVNLHEGLTRYGVRTGANGTSEIDPAKIEPHLADSWTVSPDGKTCVFKLRRGVKSPFGNELTAAAVVWSFEKSASQKRTGQFMPSAGRIARVEAVSKHAAPAPTLRCAATPLRSLRACCIHHRPAFITVISRMLRTHIGHCAIV